MDVAVGDTVLYLATEAIEVELEGQTYYVISQSAIIAVLAQLRSSHFLGDSWL